MAHIDQGAVMKKPFIVLILAAMHCGCATPTTPQVDNRSLISYSEIAAEIKISHQSTSRPDEWPQPVAANLPN